MPRPTPTVKRVCYADDITVWASGPKIPQLESMINSYLRYVDIYMKEISLLISMLKSTVTLFTPDTLQFQMRPDITLEDTQLPLERIPKILGVIMDPSLPFHRLWSFTTRCETLVRLRIYGGIWWDQFVCFAISTMGALTDLTTNLVVANNNCLVPYITENTPTPHRYRTQHSTVTELHTLNNTVAKGFKNGSPCMNNYCSTQ